MSGQARGPKHAPFAEEAAAPVFSAAAAAAVVFSPFFFATSFLLRISRVAARAQHGRLFVRKRQTCAGLLLPSHGQRRIDGVTESFRVLAPLVSPEPGTGKLTSVRPTSRAPVSLVDHKR